MHGKYTWTFFETILQEYRLTNLNKLTFIGKVAKICHHQRQQSRGAMSPNLEKMLQKLMGTLFVPLNFLSP